MGHRARGRGGGEAHSARREGAAPWRGALHDLYHDPLVLTADPSLTAIACIQLALETFGIQVPFVGSDSWYKVMDDKVSKDKLWEVMTRIMEVYNKEADMIESIAKKC